MNEQNRELIVKAGFPNFEQMYVVTERAELERFAELVRADEREACAAECRYWWKADDCEKAILARNVTPKV